MAKVLKNRLWLLMANNKIKSMSELERQLRERNLAISRQSLDRFEKGQSKRLDYDTITNLCAFFECSIGDLLYLEDE